MEKVNHKGFTLLEVLITMVIMSIGLLGIATLQIVGLKNNHSAYLRTQVVSISNEYADILRASAIGNCGCPTNSACSIVQITNSNLTAWKTYVNFLPSAQVNVLINGSICTIYIAWQDDTNDSDSKGVDVNGDGNINSGTEKLKVLSSRFQIP